MNFGIAEYTVVFRRVQREQRETRQMQPVWIVTHPTFALREPLSARQCGSSDELAQVFFVPICSTLALDERSYERFLTQSGVLEYVLRLLSRLTFAQPDAAETVRRRIQSLVMAAEVQHIVDSMPA